MQHRSSHNMVLYYGSPEIRGMQEIVMKKTKKGRKYYGCENNPECDFMSWQKPSAKKCPKCGNYMLEKGNKLVCSQETCGYVEQKPKDED